MISLSMYFQVECLALSPDGTLLATGSVDKHITLSTVEVSKEYLEGVSNDTVELPYAKIPAKTTSSFKGLLKEGEFSLVSAFSVKHVYDLLITFD